METRDTNILRRFEGQWVGIIRTGAPGRNGLVGYMRLGRGVYTPKPGKGKWAYEITDVIRIPLQALPPVAGKGPRAYRKLA